MSSVMDVTVRVTPRRGRQPTGGTCRTEIVVRGIRTVLTAASPRPPIVAVVNRWRELVDLSLAGLMVGFCLGGTGPAAHHQNATAPALAYVLAAICAASIALWRRRPLWTFAICGGTTVIYVALGYAYGPILLVLALAAYGLAARRPVREALPAITTGLVALMTAIGLGVLTDNRELAEVVSVSAWLVIPTAVGVAVRVRTEAREQVHTEQARRAVSEERLHLAQEVHDVVGHSLAVVVMQAGVALRVLDRDPDGARAALSAIRSSGQEALDGLRAEVAALRGVPGLTGAPRRPTTGLADLPGLADRMRAAGLPVTVDALDALEGLEGLPPDVDHAAYRIVQESLTNVLRHAGTGVTARVRMEITDGTLAIEVSDTGQGAQPAASGHGIAGMRERAEALGGTLTAGACPGGGFAVQATLSVRAAGDD
jgi:signal transduction histidine kinase